VSSSHSDEARWELLYLIPLLVLSIGTVASHCYTDVSTHSVWSVSLYHDREPCKTAQPIEMPPGVGYSCGPKEPRMR